MLKIHKTRDYKPHADAMRGVRYLRQPDTPEAEKRPYQLMGALLLCACSYEGYLNWIGRKLFPSWEDFERWCSWAAKTGLIADKIGLTLDRSRKPYQMIKLLFELRDSLAHMKPDKLYEEREVAELDVTFYEQLQSRVEKHCTSEYIEQFEQAVIEFVNSIHEKANVTNEGPFWPGSSGGGSSEIRSPKDPR